PALATTYGGAQMFDFRSAMKAAQALSGEIARQSLIDKLLHIAMENAGARRAWFILAEGQDLSVVASAAVDAGGVEPAAVDLPPAIINYVARTGTPLVLGDAGREGKFRNDARVIARNCRSIACVPLLRSGRLCGILYLENDLVAGAFAPDRVE